jgi:hypothetical protein
MKLHRIALVVDFEFTIKLFSFSGGLSSDLILLVVHFSPRSTEMTERSAQTRR